MMSLVPALQVTVSLGVSVDHPDHAHLSSSAVHTHHPERLHTQREAAVDV